MSYFKSLPGGVLLIRRATIAVLLLVALDATANADVSLTGTGDLDENKLQRCLNELDRQLRTIVRDIHKRRAREASPATEASEGPHPGSVLFTLVLPEGITPIARDSAIARSYIASSDTAGNFLTDSALHRQAYEKPTSDSTRGTLARRMYDEFGNIIWFEKIDFNEGTFLSIQGMIAESLVVEGRPWAKRYLRIAPWSVEHVVLDARSTERPDGFYDLDITILNDTGGVLDYHCRAKFDSVGSETYTVNTGAPHTFVGVNDGPIRFDYTVLGGIASADIYSQDRIGVETKIGEIRDGQIDGEFYVTTARGYFRVRVKTLKGGGFVLIDPNDSLQQVYYYDAAGNLLKAGWPTFQVGSPD